MEVPQSVGELTETLRQGGYLADRGLATALFVSLSLNRPILLEGEVGVGKTEVAKVMASVFGRKLIRLQCYEGIDTSQALYEWDYARQMLHIRALSSTRWPTPTRSTSYSARSSCWSGRCWRRSGPGIRRCC
jgi:MoxR-like ATPase